MRHSVKRGAQDSSLPFDLTYASLTAQQTLGNLSFSVLLHPVLAIELVDSPLHFMLLITGSTMTTFFLGPGYIRQLAE